MRMFNYSKTNSVNLVTSLILFFLCVSYSAKSAKAKDYELNPEHYDIFHGIKDRIYLCDGLWKLKKLENTDKNPKNDPGIQKGFWKTDFNDKDWSDQVVPWNWDDGYPQTWGTGNPKKIGELKAFSGVGWYRKKFFIPKESQGKRVMLWFGGVSQDAEVYVNGKKIGAHSNFIKYSLKQNYDLESFEFDITDAVKFGAENTLALRVYHDGKGYAKHQQAGRGIWQPVYITLEPSIYARKIRVTPKVKDSEIDVSCVLVNATGKEVSIDPYASVKSYQSKRYKPAKFADESSKKLGEIKLLPGENKYSFTMKLKSPVFWDFENPHLYLLELKSDFDNNKQLMGAARFGFREFRTEKNRFLLNGKPVRLRGTDHPLALYGRSDLWANQYDFVGKHVKFEKQQLNFNFSRTHRWLGKAFHDICDEQGFLLNDGMPAHHEVFFNKWAIKGLASPPELMNPKNMQINQKYVDGVVKPWIQASYNHPCVVMYNVVNEAYDSPKKKWAPTLDKFYDLIKSLDKTRIVASFSGRFPGKDAVTKTDFYDVHDYAGSCNVLRYNYILDSLTKYRDGFVGQFKSVKPMINGEGLLPSFPVPSYLSRFPGCPRLKDKESISKKEYVDFFENIVKAYNEKPGSISIYQILSMQNTPLKDAFDWDYGAHAVRADGYKRIIEPHRFSDAVEGFCIHSHQLRSGPIKGKKVADIRAIVKKAIGNACEPLLIACEFPDTNVFADQEMKLKLWVVNDTLKEMPSSLEADIDIKDKSGEVMKSKTLKVGKIAVGERKFLSESIHIPDDLETGHYKLELKLRDGDKKITSNEYELFVLGKDDCENELSSYQTGFLTSFWDLFTGDSNVKVALGLEDNPVAKKLKTVLDSFDVEYSVIKDWSELDNFDVLLIAGLGPEEDFPENSELEKSRKVIEKWVAGGGKLVSISHKSPNPILGLPSSKIAPVPYPGGNYFAEVVVPEHPLFNKLSQNCWNGWNGKRARIYTKLITPLSESVLLRGGGARLFGMVAAEAKSGKGLVLADETLAIEKYDSDSVARKYFDNLLNYVFADEWDGRHASTMRGKARNMRKKQNIKVGKIFHVDMRKQVNRGFKDDKDGDKKGGWVDQGVNDMRHFPVGKQKFLGVGFDIINPKTNKDKSCVILGGQHRPYFPEKVTIPVNRKAKRLFFLVTAAWCGKESGKAADIHINYQGGVGVIPRRTLPLVAGTNIIDWTASDVTLPKAEVAWRKINPASNSETFVYLVEWENPEPEIEITHIDFVSGGKPVPVLFAITGEVF